MTYAKLIEEIFELEVEGVKVFITYGFKYNKYQVVNVQMTEDKLMVQYQTHGDEVLIKINKDWVIKRLFTKMELFFGLKKII